MTVDPYARDLRLEYQGYQIALCVTPHKDGRCGSGLVPFQLFAPKGAVRRMARYNSEPQVGTALDGAKRSERGFGAAVIDPAHDAASIVQFDLLGLAHPRLV